MPPTADPSPFEGTHVTWADLAGGPGACADAPDSFADGSHPSSRFVLSPVTWHEPAAAGVAVRGPKPSTVDIWTDWPVPRAFTVDNLTSYRRDGGGPALTAFGGRWHPLVVDALGIRARHPSRCATAEAPRRGTLAVLDLATGSGRAL
jgi:hypothetical protein